MLTDSNPSVPPGAIFSAHGEARTYLSFQDIETHVLRNLAAVEACNYVCIVALARGGLYAGAMLSQFTGLPLVVATFERQTRRVGVDISQGSGKKLLLVDDIAGMGHTLTETKARLESLGWSVDTFVTAWDALSRSRPTYGMKMASARPVWPWERGILGEDFSPERRTADPDRWLRAFDLDGVFLDDVPSHLYETDLPEALRLRENMPVYGFRPINWVNNGKALIISARLQSEQGETEGWLHRNGLQHAGVHLRTSLDVTASEHKAQRILQLGVTEFVESEHAQALEISRIAPHCVVWHYDAQSQVLLRIG